MIYSNISSYCSYSIKGILFLGILAHSLKGMEEKFSILNQLQPELIKYTLNALFIQNNPAASIRTPMVALLNFGVTNKQNYQYSIHIDLWKPLLTVLGSQKDTSILAKMALSSLLCPILRQHLEQHALMMKEDPQFTLPAWDLPIKTTPAKEKLAIIFNISFLAATNVLSYDEKVKALTLLAHFHKEETTEERVHDFKKHLIRGIHILVGQRIAAHDPPLNFSKLVETIIQQPTNLATINQLLAESDTVKELLTTKDLFDIPPLAWAAYSDRSSQIVQLLLDKEKEYNLPSSYHIHALYAAVENNNYNALRVLLKENPDVTLGTLRNPSPFLYSVIRGNFYIMKSLLNTENFQFHTDSHGATALHYAADYNHVHLLDFFHSAPNAIPIDAPDNNQRTPLSYAAANGGREAIEFLLTHGANINSTDKHGFTPTMKAAEKGKIDNLTYLYASDADIQAKTAVLGNTALHLAAQKGKCDVIPMLVAAGLSVDTLNGLGSTPLMVASHNGREEAVKLLIKLKASIDKHNQLGFTAKSIALGENYPAIVALLTEHSPKKD